MRTTAVQPLRTSPRSASPLAAPTTQPRADGWSPKPTSTRSSRPTDWYAGRPLGEAKNAHRTNTVEQFDEAMKNGSNFFEGDVRRELNAPYQLEMRHDRGQEDGDNLTLRQWLRKGAASGRGLKLDIKEPEHMEALIAEVKAAGIPDGRLMLNLGQKSMAQWGGRLRREFPHATLAFGGDISTRTGVDRLLHLADRLGGPVTFVQRIDSVNAEAVKRLTPRGPVSVWNDPNQGGVDDVATQTARLRQLGVTGMIDLRPSRNLFEKAVDVLHRVF